MRKKLNLVLREPVKLHEAETTISVKTAIIKEDNETKKIVEKASVKNKKIEKTKPKVFREVVAEKPKIENEPPKLLPSANDDLIKLLETMSPRVRQIWDYFCEAAREDGDLKNSFTVTRAEVMKKANIGSTNTYRDALRKFKEIGLIEIKLRPGVNTGSVFYLTEKGKQLVS